MSLVCSQQLSPSIEHFEGNEVQISSIQVLSHDSASHICFPPLFAVEFDLEKGSFLTPRGRYSIELCVCN